MEILPFLSFCMFAFAWIVQCTAVLLAIRWSWRKKNTEANIREIRCDSGSIKYTGKGDVTIIKPVTGADPSLRSNLTSFFYLKYDRQYKVVFCVNDANDSAVPIIQDCIAAHPHISATLVTKERDVGINPKINTINSAYESADTEYIWICDSGVCARPDTLYTLVRRSCDTESKDCGIVHQLPVRINCSTFGDQVEQMHFGTAHAKWYFFINFAGKDVVNGMSNLFRRSLLEDIGGLRPYAKYLAEDYFINEAIWQRGFRARLASTPARQSHAGKSLRDVYYRTMRWARLRRRIFVVGAVVEPLTDCLLSGLLGAYALAASLPSTHLSCGQLALAVVAVHMVCWFCLDMAMLRAVNGNTVMPPRFWVGAWLTREIGSVLLNVHGALSNSVMWRGKQYYLEKNTIIRVPEHRLL
eukprot:m.174706 g.174706  ORF g.174706 m.174706 type:complete len:413 (+) comp18333_c0_seq2:241-1479(+)